VKHVLILGANSGIAEALARRFAAAGETLTLASRDTAKLQIIASDIRIRFQCEVAVAEFDAVAFESHAAFYEGLIPKPDVVVIAFGYLGAKPAVDVTFDEMQRILEINYLGAANVLELVAADLEKRGQGAIIGISSVAGARGRRSNYLYGSAKAALTTHLSGLRNRLSGQGAFVMTVLPGFVRTKMTDHLDSPSWLVASPERVARDIFRAFRKKRDVVWTPWFWKWIMLLIALIPERIFKKLSL
jgi:decaprenylphospho-beta-D-erythro-pentofuranosid-2-ulose 2-reductase